MPLGTKVGLGPGDIVLHGAVARCMGHSEMGAAVLLKAVWWDLRLASLLTDLFSFNLYRL